MNFIKDFGLSLFLFLIGDVLWFRLAGDFFKTQLGPIARLDQGQFSPRLVAALLVYLLMAFSVAYFVFHIQSPDNLKQAAFRGALLGLVVYGVFDLTNRALLNQYPLPMVIVDMTWGLSIFTLVSVAIFQIRKFVF